MPIHRLEPLRDWPERNALVEAHGRLVPWVVGRLSPRLIAAAGGWDDAVQGGYLGLMRAAELYREDLGKFSGYAYRHIRAGVQAEARKRGVVAIPAHFLEGSKIPPTLQEHVERALRASYLSDITSRSLRARTEEPPDTIEEKESAARVRSWLDLLPDSWAYVLRRIYLDGLSREEVSREMGRSRNRVQQIEARALHELRTILEAA